MLRSTVAILAQRGLYDRYVAELAPEHGSFLFGGSVLGATDWTHRENGRGPEAREGVRGMEALRRVGGEGHLTWKAGSHAFESQDL
jgi:hypothetical protein